MKATSTNLSGKLIEMLPNTTAPLVVVYMYNRSEQTDPRKALPTDFDSWMGFWMTPYDISKSIDWYIHQNPSKTLGT